MIYEERVIELHNSGITSVSNIARIIQKEINPNMNIKGFSQRSIRRGATEILAKYKHPSLAGECEAMGVPIENVNHYWYKGEHHSLHVKTDKDEFNPDEFLTELTAAMSEISPKYPKISRKKYEEAHCLVFDAADIHIGKLCSSFEVGEDYDTQVAIKRVREGLHGIIRKSRGYDIDKVVFIAGNDILHTDNPRRQTTSGTPQDTDGMWYENFVNAQKLLTEIIETLMSIADVEVVYNPSNHDYMSGFMLLQSVKSWFRKSKNVEFKTDMSHRKYSTYGKNLIGTTHMDGAKIADLPLLMAQEASEHWHHCKHRYIYGHHVHHKSSKDFGSVCVETLRSPSGTDSWHHRNGYQHSPKAVEGYIHHKEHGQVARLTHIF
jgi:hypothetical protein